MAKQILNTSIPAIVGHQSQRRRLQQLIVKNKMPPTMMFAGAAGIGKRLAALELCRTLACDSNFPPKSQAQAERIAYGGCGKCKACHVFDSGNYPDFHFVQALDRDNWNIAAFRQLLYSLNLNAFSGKSRLVVVDNAEYMSEQAANLLLKTLEEPRPGTYYLLVTASPSKLPSTLLSRCQIWFFDMLMPEEVERVIGNIKTADPQGPLSLVPPGELALLSDGSVDGLETIAEHHSQWIEIKDRLERVFGGDIPEANKFAAELARNKDSLRIPLQFLRIAARRKMREDKDQETAAKWALFLTNIIAAEKLIFDRKLAPFNVLGAAFLNLAARNDLPSFTRLTNSASLLEKISV